MSLFNKVFQKHLDEHNASFAEPVSEPTDVPLQSDTFDFVEATPTPDTVEAAEEAEEEDFGPAPELVARAAEAQQLLKQTRSAPVSYQEPEPSAQKGNRNKTRILGFSPEGAAIDPFTEKPQSSAQDAFPCGWLVVTDGPGRGASFSLHSGVAQIGRGDGQAIQLDFGDRAISREHHAAVAFDSETGKFFLGHGGKSNIIRLNGRPVLSTEELDHGDALRIGETELRFVALCGANFNWAEAEV